MARSKRIAAILADEDFAAVVSEMEQRLTRKVMATATLQEDRDFALAQFHALQSLMATMRAEAQEE